VLAFAEDSSAGVAFSGVGPSFAAVDRWAHADGRTLTIVWAALLGFSDAAALIVGLTLPALLCPPEDVARISAGTFTLSYGGGVAIAVVSGAAWDVSGVPAMAFAPLAICGVALVAIALSMRTRRELR
jgi:hypothetical protein